MLKSGTVTGPAPWPFTFLVLLASHSAHSAKYGSFCFTTPPSPVRVAHTHPSKRRRTSSHQVDLWASYVAFSFVHSLPHQYQVFTGFPRQPFGILISGPRLLSDCTHPRGINFHASPHWITNRTFSPRASMSPLPGPRGGHPGGAAQLPGDPAAARGVVHAAILRAGRAQWLCSSHGVRPRLAGQRGEYTSGLYDYGGTAWVWVNDLRESEFTSCMGITRADNRQWVLRRQTVLHIVNPSVVCACKESEPCVPSGPGGVLVCVSGRVPSVRMSACFGPEWGSPVGSHFPAPLAPALDTCLSRIAGLWWLCLLSPHLRSCSPFPQTFAV